MIVEWAPFTVNEGIKDSDLIAVANRLQTDFLAKQAGYVRRELLKGAGNGWVDLIYWTTEKEAKAAFKNSENSPACAEYFGLMAPADPQNTPQGFAHFKRMANW